MRAVATDKVREIVGRLPTTRDENWKYTDLARVRDISLRWLEAGATSPPLSLEEKIAAVTDSIDADWIIFSNGVLRDLPSQEGLACEKLESAPASDDALAELNAALLRDGLRLRIGGPLAKPIGLLFIDGGKATTVSQGYVEIEAARSASAEIIEFHTSVGEADQYANTVLKISVGDNAAVGHVRIQDRGLNHVQTSATCVDVGRDGRFHSASFDFGGGLIRNDLNIDIARPGADVSFDGLYLAGDQQHIDNHTRVDHRVGPATSRQEYRGILNGKCRCVWNGKVIVHDGADLTDADQANHNLLLSSKAEIDTKPELEIYTDDVKCSHGTTVGQLDDTALFYLRTRGLDKRHATQVLTRAFAAGLISRVPVESATAAVSRLMEERLAELIRSDEDFT